MIDISVAANAHATEGSPDPVGLSENRAFSLQQVVSAFEFYVNGCLRDVSRVNGVVIQL